MQRLLVSVRGPKEALEAANGGAHIIDVAYPASALGTPYPLNILTVRNRLKRFGNKIQLSTNIGGKQFDRAAACQAALGVAAAGAQVVKCGLAELPLDAAQYLGDSLVRTVKKFFPRKQIILAVFIDEDLQRFLRPFEEGPRLAAETHADGIFVDTFNKSIGRGLLDYCTTEDIAALAGTLHKNRRQLWVSGSISYEELAPLWQTGVDVIGVRRAACEERGRARFGEVKSSLVEKLVETIPK